MHSGECAQHEMDCCMRDATEADVILEKLYDTVLQPERLADTLESLDRWLDSDLCHLVGMDRDEKSVCLSVMTNTTRSNTDVASMNRGYAEYFHLLDPRRRIARQGPTGRIFTCSDYFDGRYADRSEFYQDFLRPFGARYVAGGCLLRNDTQEIYIAFNHMLGRDPFTQEDIERIQSITPHLQRAIKLLVQTEAFRASLRAGELGLAALDHGVIVLSRSGAIVFANERASNVLGERRILRSNGNKLQAVQDTSLLEDVLSRVHTSRLPESLALRTMTSSGREAQCLYLTILGVPLQRHEVNFRRPKSDSSDNQFHAGESCSSFNIIPNADLIVLISTPRRSATVSAKQLKQLFHLSPAEARLTHALGRGLSMEEYADEACVSMPTVRTHLRSVLKKTGERRQQDLVRMLATLPAARI